MLPAMPDVPMPVAIGFGLACLGAGAIVTAAIVRDKLATARRLTSRAATLGVRTDTILHRVEAITSPTQGMPLVQLEAATRTPTERLVAGLADLRERVREAVANTGHTADWGPGEMTAAFRKIVDDTPDWELPSPTEIALVDDLPANRPQVVHPLRPTAPPPMRPQPPALVRASGQPQPAPRWQDLPAPPTRARSRGAMAMQVLRARGRDWGTMLGEKLPVMDPPPFPEPFRMPGQRPLPHDPRRLAMLDPDPTRRWRTRVGVPQ